MATITIKIDSEQLAREVLTQLGYLPEDADDVPDLISVDEAEEPEAKEPEASPPVEEIYPEPNDEGFGTPLDQTGSIDLGYLTDGLVDAVARHQELKDKEMKDLGEAITTGLSLPTPVTKVKSTTYDNIREYIKHPLPTPLPAYEPSAIEAAARREEYEEMIRKREQKRLKQENEREILYKWKESLPDANYITYLKERLSSEDDKDIKQVLYEFLGDTDPEFIKYIEENEPMPYEEWLEF